MSKPLFQRRHYKKIAHVLQQMDMPGDCVEPIIRAFDYMLLDDNSNFNTQKFHDAIMGKAS